MRPSLLLRLAGLTLPALMAVGISCSDAQVVVDERVSPELLDLYDEFRAWRATGAPVDEFVPGDSTLRVDSAFVLIDATAVDSGESLLDELSVHGLRDGSAYQLVVSGWLQIDSVAVLTQLTHLKFARASQMATGRGDL